MAPNDPEVIADQVSNVYLEGNGPLFGLFVLQNDFPSEVGIMDDFVQR